MNSPETIGTMLADLLLTLAIHIHLNAFCEVLYSYNQTLVGTNFFSIPQPMQHSILKLFLKSGLFLCMNIIAVCYIREFEFYIHIPFHFLGTLVYQSPMRNQH